MIESKLEKKRKNILGKRQSAIFRKFLRKLGVIGFVSTSFQVMDGFAAFNDAIYLFSAAEIINLLSAISKQFK